MPSRPRARDLRPPGVPPWWRWSIVGAFWQRWFPSWDPLVRVSYMLAFEKPPRVTVYVWRLAVVLSW